MRKAERDGVAATRPSSAEQFAVAMARLYDFARLFGIRDFDSELATKFYRAGLRSLPADLLWQAVNNACATHDNSYRLPMPAEIRRSVEEEMQWRRSALVDIRCAIDAIEQTPGD